MSDRYDSEMERLPEKVFIPGYMANDMFFSMGIYDIKADPESTVSMPKDAMIDLLYGPATDKECTATMILLMNPRLMPDA